MENQLPRTLRGPVQAAASDRIALTARAWPGIQVDPLPYNGTDFLVGRREIGHVHGNATMDIPFPKSVRDDLVASGRAEPHHTLKNTGWVSVPLRSSADVERALQLLRMSYNLAVREQQCATLARCGSWS